MQRGPIGALGDSATFSASTDGMCALLPDDDHATSAFATDVPYPWYHLDSHAVRAAAVAIDAPSPDTRIDTLTAQWPTGEDRGGHARALT